MPKLVDFRLVLLLASALVLPLAASAQPSLLAAEEPTYYSIEPDRRLCPAPFCGGYFIREVNRRRTRCLDGTVDKACYVAGIDWGRIGLNGSEGAELVLGVQQKSDFGGFPGFAELAPKAAWRPASDQEPKGRWAALADNGIVCVTHPCFDIDLRILNRWRRQRAISGVDLSHVDATEADVEAAWKALEDDELIAVGRTHRIPNAGPAGRAVEFVASQFFLRVRRPLDPDRFCTADNQCVATPFDRFVGSRDECYCPLCPTTPLNFRAEQRNRGSWTKICSDWAYPGPRPTPIEPLRSVPPRPGSLAELAQGPVSVPMICPVPACIAPPPVACIENQCAFVEDRLIVD